MALTPTGASTPARSRSPLPDAVASPALLDDGLAVDHPRRPPLAAPSWRTNVIVRLLAFAGLTALIGVGIALVLPLVLHLGRYPRDWGLWPAVLSIVASVGGYWVVGRLLERRRLVELAPSRIGGLIAGLLLGFVLLSGVVAVITLLGGLRFSGFQTPYDCVPFLTLAGFQASIVEEILFRGVLFRYVEEVLGTWGAVAVSAAVFGRAHLSNPHASVLGAVAIAIEAGLLFGAVYALTRSLWVVIGLHFAWNVTQGLLFDIPVSGVASVGYLRTEAAGPDLLSGGEFGIEASLVTMVLLGAFSLWLLTLVARRHRAVAPFWVRRRRVAAASPASVGAAV